MKQHQQNDKFESYSFDLIFASDPQRRHDFQYLHDDHHTFFTNPIIKTRQTKQRKRQV